MATDLKALVEGIRGSTFVTIRTRTTPKMRKTNNPYHGHVFSVARYNVELNFWLGKAVRKQLAIEGKDPESYVAGTTWHRAVLRADGTLTPFRAHKDTGELYLWVRILRKLEGHFEDDAGREVDAAILEPFIQRNENYSRQGTEKKIPVITLKFSSVTEVAINHDIVDTSEAADLEMV